MSEVVALCVTARVRGGERLHELPEPPPPDPPITSLAALVSGSERRVWLTGGEATLRADLPELIRAVSARGPSVGLVTDALPLAKEGALGPLLAAGLDRVRVVLHAARADAHDWLVARPGAARLAVRALGRLVAAGVDVELLATLTRSTLPLAAELVETARSLGVRSVRMRRPVAQGRVALAWVELVPRFALMGAHLERALAAARDRDVRLTFEGFPECVAPRDARALPGAVPVLALGEPQWERVRAALAEPPHEKGCPSCPGLPRCAGMPRDYGERFGRSELHAGALGATLRGATPAPRVVRVRFPAPARVECEACGDASDGAFVESTRSARLRLVRAAGTGARILRVASAGSLAHPERAALLRETTLLSFERVELAGEASALDELGDADLFALRGITRLDVALYAPDTERHDAHVGRSGAFAQALRAGERLRELAGAELGSFAVLHDASLVHEFADAWATGRLPGAPCFRLSPRGGRLEDLARVARELQPGPARVALVRTLPECLRPTGDVVDAASSEAGVAFEDELEPGRPASGSDRYGTFQGCVCGASRAPCSPGVAVGWQHSIEP